MTYTLEVQNREENKKARALRREGFVPGTVYGAGIEPVSVQLSSKDLFKVPVADYRRVIELDRSGQKHEVVIKHVQKDFLTGEYLNVEFFQINNDTPISMNVVLEFIGESEALKLGASLVVQKKTASVRALPKKIPDSLKVDISTLGKPGDMIAFNSIELPEGVELTEPPKEIICKAQAKRGS